MANLIEELSSQARTLPPADRVCLAEELFATLQDVDDEVEAGTEKLISLKKYLQKFTFC